MSLIGFDGFEMIWTGNHAFNVHNWQSGDDPGIGEGVNGSDAFILDSASTFKQRFGITLTSTLVMGWAFLPKANTVLSRRLWLSVMNGSSGQISLTFEQIPAGAVTIRTGGTNGTQIAQTAASQFTVDVYDYWELRVTQSTTIGTVELRKNGVVVASATGANTGASQYNRVHIFGNVDNDGRYDDIYLTDDEFLGPVHVATLAPGSDVGPNDWTPSSGTTNWEMLIEEPADPATSPSLHYAYCDVDTTYIRSTVDGDRAVMGLEDLVPSGVPLAVELFQFVRGENDADAASMRGGLRSGGVDASVGSFTTGVDLAAGFYGFINPPAVSRNFQTYELDPNGDIPWTRNAINALQVFVENETNFPVRCTRQGVQVLLGLEPVEESPSFVGWGIPL